MPAEWEPQIQKWWNEGLGRTEIARRLGTTKAAIDSQINRMRCRGLALPHRQGHYRDFVYEPADFDSANCADPAALVRWLEEQGLYGAVNRKDQVGRCVRHWVAGVPPDFYQVDRVFTALGRHISELPVEVWQRRHSVTVQRDAA